MGEWIYRINLWYDRLPPDSRFIGFFSLLISILVVDVTLSLFKLFPISGMVSAILYIGLLIPRMWYMEFSPRYRSYNAGPQYSTGPSQSHATYNDDLQILGLREMPQTMTILKRAYRKAARSAHPDTGGSDAAFIAVREAYLRIKNRMTQ